MRDKSDNQNKDTVIKSWRMRVSYLGPETLYEVELREPLKGFASEKYTMGLNGLVEFEMFSDPLRLALSDIWMMASCPPNIRC